MKKYLPKIEYFRGLVMRFWIIILVAGVAGAALSGIAYRLTYEPQYEMTQAFTIELEAYPNANDASASETQLSKTIPALLSSEIFISYMTPFIREANASGQFKVTSLETSNIFYITCVARSNNDAQIIINQIQEHYSDIADYVVGKSQMKLLAPPGYSKLPTNAPHYTISVFAGLFAGAFLVLALFALLAFFSNTVTDAGELEATIHTKCLSVINRVYIKKRSKEKGKKYHLPLSTDEKADFEYKKSIATLSTNADQICMKKGFKSILVSSTVSGEGKSTIALNLALDLADKGKRVVILDYDLRSPSVAEYLEIDQIDLTIPNVVKTDTPNLYFCGNAKGISESFDDVTDDAIEKLVASLKSQFDYVIIDTAPVGLLGDAISISNFADCFLYVVAYNYVHKSTIIGSIANLNESNNNMLGFVLTNK